MNSYQLGLWDNDVAVKEKMPYHLKVFKSAAKLKLKGQTTAIVSNPNHPLNGQKVWILRNKGETVEVLSAHGRTILISAELRPIQPGRPEEDWNAELKTLRYAMALLLNAEQQNKRMVEEIKSMFSLMGA